MCSLRAERGKRGPVTMFFYSGGDMPLEEVTHELIGTFGAVPAYGCLLRGRKGLLQAGLWNMDCYVNSPARRDSSATAITRNQSAETGVSELLPKKAAGKV